MSTVNNPFPYFPDAGTNGYIYIGSANQDAQTNPIVAYRDAELTAPWSQPIRTVNGYAAYQGAKAGIFLGVSEFSITVKDSNGVIVLNDNAAQRFLNYDDLTSATSIIVTARDEAEAAATAAALSEAEAESARDAANSAAVAAQQYYPGARSYVPQGAVTGAATISTAGSGGTNGTFDLAWSGGNFAVNPTGTFTVTGGAVTAITITGPGLYIGNALSKPTMSFAASAGLTGAAGTFNTAYLKTAGQYWLTDTSPASNYLALFQNQANAAVEIDAQFDPMSAGAAAASATAAANSASALARIADWSREARHGVGVFNGATNLAGDALTDETFMGFTIPSGSTGVSSLLIPRITVPREAVRRFAGATFQCSVVYVHTSGLFTDKSVAAVANEAIYFDGTGTNSNFGSIVSSTAVDSTHLRRITSFTLPSGLTSIGPTLQISASSSTATTHTIKVESVSMTCTAVPAGATYTVGDVNDWLDWFRTQIDDIGPVYSQASWPQTLNNGAVTRSVSGRAAGVTIPTGSTGLNTRTTATLTVGSGWRAALTSGIPYALILVNHSATFTRPLYIQLFRNGSIMTTGAVQVVQLSSTQRLYLLRVHRVTGVLTGAETSLGASLYIPSTGASATGSDEFYEIVDARIGMTGTELYSMTPAQHARFIADARVRDTIAALSPTITANYLLPDKLWMTEGRVLPFNARAMASARVDGAFLDVTLESLRYLPTTPQATSPKPGLQLRGSGTLMLDPDAIDTSVTATIRRFGVADTRHQKTMTVNIAAWDKTGKTPKILIMGDSLAAQGKTASLRMELLARGMTPTMIGTIATTFNGTNATVAEGRGGKSAADYLYIRAYDSGNSSTMQPVGAMSYATYAALTDTQKTGYNPFLVAGSGAGYYNGYKWSLSQYLSYTGQTTPTHVFISLGTNDFLQFAQATALANIATAIQHIVSEIRAVDANIIIGFYSDGIGWRAGINDALGIYEYHHQMMQTQYATIAALGDAKVHYLPFGLHQDDNRFGSMTTSSTDAYGLKTVVDDVSQAGYIHPTDGNVSVAASVMASLVAATV